MDKKIMMKSVGAGCLTSVIVFFGIIALVIYAFVSLITWIDDKVYESGTPAPIEYQIDDYQDYESSDHVFNDYGVSK